MYHYVIDGGEYMDKESIVLVNKKLYSQEEFNSIYSQYKNQTSESNMWEFVRYIINNFGFSYPEIKASIDTFENN